MKVATWNVNGIRARQEQYQAWLLEESPDICCLQEIKAAPDQVPATVSETEGYWSYWHGGKGYSGVALQLRRERFPHKPLITHPDFDHETRIAIAELPDLDVASVYVPNGGKDFGAKLRFLKALDLYAAARQKSGRPLVLCGDMNVARADIDVHPKERKKNCIGQLPQERELLERIISRGLDDLLRSHDPDNDQIFTWWPPWRNMRQRNIGWRIDYVLAGRDLRSSACEVRAQVGTSDHAPVVAVFDV
jgi:exodeoxyribonuclease-3